MLSTPSRVHGREGTSASCPDGRPSTRITDRSGPPRSAAPPVRKWVRRQDWLPISMMLPAKVDRSINCRAAPWVGERVGPGRERPAAGDGHAVGLLPFGEHL